MLPTGKFIINSSTPLSDATLAEVTPAVMNETGPAPAVSDLYGFVPTIGIIRELRKLGYEVFMAMQIKGRKRPVRFYPHIVFMHKPNDFNEHGMIEEISIFNSHDRTRAITLSAGLYDPVKNVRMSLPMLASNRPIRHMQGNVVNYLEGIPDIGEIHAMAVQHIEAMQNTFLNQIERLQFAEIALGLRFPKDCPTISPAQLLPTNEVNDLRGDLWSTLIDVHNSLLNGRIQFPSKRINKVTGQPHMSATRRVSNMDVVAKFQRELWGFGVEYLDYVAKQRAAA